MNLVPGKQQETLSETVSNNSFEILTAVVADQR